MSLNIKGIALNVLGPLAAIPMLRQIWENAEFEMREIKLREIVDQMQPLIEAAKIHPDCIVCTIGFRIPQGEIFEGAAGKQCRGVIFFGNLQPGPVLVEDPDKQNVIKFERQPDDHVETS